ncbi:MAG: response regulator [Chloroflexi bacterium]|nr:response regulator [Chloroflexota bacterium]MDK1044718.1 response regulator [Anaerolineales bacterium]MCH8877131.1 response regulator [Chloroflexota bacterium]MCI0772346.1 response regulator [Chloroflexota bacterium]MCI0806405.1 response regulator [Chloroflexota bacterium]
MARVLIVDDNQAMVEALSIVVSARGHDALTALSGEEALRLIASEMLDVVLLDLTMPGLDGFETLDRLRTMPEGKDLPVLIITALDEEDLEDRVAEAGGNALLRKPVDVNRLADQIEVHTASTA